MSESDDSKQQSDVDVTQGQQDEDKLRTEGGARLNGRLAATGVGVAMGLVVLLTLAVQSSGPRQSAQSGDASHDGDNTTADKTAVQDLIANATARTPAPVYQAPATAPSSMVIPSRQTEASAPPRQPSRYAEWEREKYMKALEAPQMVAAFHDSTLEIPSRLRRDDRVDNAGENPGSLSPPEGAAVRLHPPASPYTVMAGGVIPAVLVSGINSDLPGPILAQVSQNVYDVSSAKIIGVT